MNPWVAVVRALPMTFVVYVSSTILGAVHALPVALELEALPGLSTRHESVRIAAIEQFIALSPMLRAQGLSLLLAVIGYMLLSPWLHMAWLSALSAPKGPGNALSDGARLIPRACLTTFWVGLGSALLLLPCAALVWIVRAWLASRANVRVQDLGTVFALAPALTVLFLSFAWHDLARARCLSSGAFRSSMRSFLDALRPLTLLRCALWTGLGLTLSICAQLGSLHDSLRGSVGLLVTLIMVQGAALARSTLRSRWLTEALIRADSPAVAPKPKRYA